MNLDHMALKATKQIEAITLPPGPQRTARILIYARRAEDAIQLRNLLDAVREDNQRLRAELSEIRAQDSDLAERDEPLTLEDKALLDRAWEKHAAARSVCV